MTAALLILLAAFSRVDLVDETFDIAAHDWSAPRQLTAEPAMVDCVFQSDRPNAKVRLVLLSKADLSTWRQGRDYDEIASTPLGPGGTLRMAVHEVDTYAALENRGSQPVRVHLRVFQEEPRVRYLSRERRLEVIAISFGVFFAIVSFSARKLLKAVRR